MARNELLVTAHITAEGDIQGIGYRTYVKRVARALGLKGYVRNLDDGRVEVHCEGDKSAIQRFKDEIDLKRRPGSPYAPHVAKLSLVYEGETGYVPPERPSQFFEVDYGTEAESPYERATLERLEAGTILLSGVYSQLGEFRNETKASFKDMYERYGSISASVDALSKKLDADRMALSRVVKTMQTSNRQVANALRTVVTLLKAQGRKSRS